MEIEEAVFTIAEIAVALAGFTGIVVVLGSRGDVWDDSEILRLHTLLRASLSALFCSFVPLVVTEIGLEAVGVWELSALIIGSVMAVNLVIFGVRSRGTVLPLSQRMYFVGGAVISLGLFSAAAGVLENGSLAVLVGLLWQLFIAAQNFVQLLVSGVVARD